MKLFFVQLHWMQQLKSSFTDDSNRGEKGMKRKKNDTTQIDDDDEWYSVAGKLVMDSWCFASGFDDASTTFELFRFNHTLTHLHLHTQIHICIHTTPHIYLYKRIFWINDHHSGNYFAAFEVNCLCLCACKYLHTHNFFPILFWIGKRYTKWPF